MGPKHRAIIDMVEKKYDDMWKILNEVDIKTQIDRNEVTNAFFYKYYDARVYFFNALQDYNRFYCKFVEETSKRPMPEEARQYALNQAEALKNKVLPRIIELNNRFIQAESYFEFPHSHDSILNKQLNIFFGMQTNGYNSEQALYHLLSESREQCEDALYKIMDANERFVNFKSHLFKIKNENAVSQHELAQFAQQYGQNKCFIENFLAPYAKAYHPNIYRESIEPILKDLQKAERDNFFSSRMSTKGWYYHQENKRINGKYINSQKALENEIQDRQKIKNINNNNKQLRRAYTHVILITNQCENLRYYQLEDVTQRRLTSRRQGHDDALSLSMDLKRNFRKVTMQVDWRHSDGGRFLDALMGPTQAFLKEMGNAYGFASILKDNIKDSILNVAAKDLKSQLKDMKLRLTLETKRGPMVLSADMSWLVPSGEQNIDADKIAQVVDKIEPVVLFKNIFSNLTYENFEFENDIKLDTMSKAERAQYIKEKVEFVKMFLDGVKHMGEANPWALASDVWAMASDNFNMDTLVFVDEIFASQDLAMEEKFELFTQVANHAHQKGEINEFIDKCNIPGNSLYAQNVQYDRNEEVERIEEEYDYVIRQ